LRSTPGARICGITKPSLATRSAARGRPPARRNPNVALDHVEDKMSTLSRIAVAAIVVSPLLLGAGCAQRSDITALRGEVDALRADVSTLRFDMGSLSGDVVDADARAQQAAESAAAAATAAKAAADKSDKIYRQSLRK
jgi:outer membrane murein-binding lipoprotein Lpp